MGLKQPLNGTLPRRSPSQYESQHKGWGRCHMAALTVSASALLATLITFVVLNLLLDDVNLPPLQGAPNSGSVVLGMTLQPPAIMQGQQAALNAQLAASSNKTAKAPVPPTEPVHPPPKPVYIHPFPSLKGYYSIPAKDTSPRCTRSQICDGDHSCGPDKLGCVTDASERKEHVRKAIAWAWEGYRWVRGVRVS